MEWNLSNKKLPNYLNFAQNSKKVIGFSIERPSKKQLYRAPFNIFLEKRTNSINGMNETFHNFFTIDRKETISFLGFNPRPIQKGKGGNEP